VPEIAIQDGLHHLAERTAVVRGRLMRGRAQRTVDLDRQVRTKPVRAGLASVRERRRGLAVRHVAPQLGRDPAADTPLHGLLADAERLGQRAQRPACLAQGGQRRRQQLAAPRRAELAQPGRDAIGQHEAARV